eukprot:SM000019S04952  [mRNA]  locus=s19:143202:146726:- [translate_table: standard]
MQLISDLLLEGDDAGLDLRERVLRDVLVRLGLQPPQVFKEWNERRAWRRRRRRRRRAAAGKERRRQLRELRSTMEGSDASAEEKLRLLYARFQQQARRRRRRRRRRRNSLARADLGSSGRRRHCRQLVEMRQLEAELGALRRRCEHAQRDRDLGEWPPPRPPWLLQAQLLAAARRPAGLTLAPPLLPLRAHGAALAEGAKGAAVRQKLESLCRELQRQNKAVIDESKRVALDEQHKRQELSAKFHTTIKDITSKLEDQSDERIRQIRENETLKDKLKHFTQQYEIREQHFAHQLRTKVLEQQLLEAKLKQQQDIAAQGDAKVPPGPLLVRARLLLSPADRAAASYALWLGGGGGAGGGDQAQMYLEQINQLLKTEAELRSQLAMYGDKFEQFQPHVTLAAAATQDTLTKSNEVFSTFKKEMEKMSKTIKKLEKENGSLKAKCEKSDVSIIELLDERSATKKQLETVRTQKERLEALCRSLQLERKLAASSAAATPSPGAARELATGTCSTQYT